MTLSYNGLWKLLIEKNMNKGDFMKAADISNGTVAKMTTGGASFHDCSDEDL